MALALEASLAHMQPVMRVQPCEQAGVDDLQGPSWFTICHHLKQCDAPMVIGIFRVALLEDAVNVPVAPMPRC